MLLTAKILLTLATLGYSAIPAKFDSDATHMTNPSFVGHARFHVVWQVSSYVYLGILALVLIWTGEGRANLWIAAGVAVCAYGGFWSAVLFRAGYGGTLVAAVNPVPDFQWKIGGKTWSTDANVTLFTATVLLLILGVIALLGA